MARKFLTQIAALAGITIPDAVAANEPVSLSQAQAMVAASEALLDLKPSVRAATTANITLSGLQTVDGVVLVAGDRVLVKAQTVASENGIYLAASGAWTRSTDANTSAKVTPGLFVMVEEGTALEKSQWKLTTTGAITLNTTALTFEQWGVGGGATYTAGSGVTLSGNAIAVDSAVVSTKAAATVGDGSATVIAVTHNLNSTDVLVSIRDTATNELVSADVVVTSANVVTVTFATAPAANAYRVAVHA